jgi:DNA-directed RNA polymerase specialized sigma24 family protein
LSRLVAEVRQDQGVAEVRREEQFLCRRAAELVHRTVEEKTWAAFWRVTVEGQHPADVAADLHVSVNAVYIARFRVLTRLREEFDGLIAFDDEDARFPNPDDRCGHERVDPSA